MMKNVLRFLLAQCMMLSTLATLAAEPSAKMMLREKLAVAPSCVVGVAGGALVALFDTVPLVSGVSYLFTLAKENTEGASGEGDNSPESVVRTNVAAFGPLGTLGAMLVLALVDTVVTLVDLAIDGRVEDVGVDYYSRPYAMVRTVGEGYFSSIYRPTKYFANYYFRSTATSCGKFLDWAF